MVELEFVRKFYERAMLLSIVIVAKNEENNIARCIESSLNCTKGVQDTEILLVDSCSADKTIEIAKQYPINIIQLKKHWHHSPSAGRFSGVNNVSGKYVLIIDGDMELKEGWIEKALNFMEENPKTISVVGKQYDVYSHSNGIYSRPQVGRSYKWRNHLEEIDYVFGSSIFQREAVLKAGNFHPFLRAEEEAEISYRLKINGYGLFFFLPYDSIYHYCISKNSLQETTRRARNKLWAGMGDMLSWCMRKKYYLIVYKRFKLYISFLAFIIICIVGFIYSASINKYFISFMFGLMPLAFVLLMCIKKRSIFHGMLSVLNISVITINLVGGLFRKVNDISNYPKDVVWVKRV